MGTLGAQEMLVILVLTLLCFGPRELPKIARTLSRAITEFPTAQHELWTTFSREPGVQEMLVAILLALLIFATTLVRR